MYAGSFHDSTLKSSDNFVQSFENFLLKANGRKRNLNGFLLHTFISIPETLSQVDFLRLEPNKRAISQLQMCMLCSSRKDSMFPSSKAGTPFGVADTCTVCVQNVL